MERCWTARDLAVSTAPSYAGSRKLAAAPLSRTRLLGARTRQSPLQPGPHSVRAPLPPSPNVRRSRSCCRTACAATALASTEGPGFECRIRTARLRRNSIPPRVLGRIAGACSHLGLALARLPQAPGSRARLLLQASEEMERAGGRRADVQVPGPRRRAKAARSGNPPLRAAGPSGLGPALRPRTAAARSARRSFRGFGAPPRSKGDLRLPKAVSHRLILRRRTRCIFRATPAEATSDE